MIDNDNNWWLYNSHFIGSHEYIHQKWSMWEQYLAEVQVVHSLAERCRNKSINVWYLVFSFWKCIKNSSTFNAQFIQKTLNFPYGRINACSGYISFRVHYVIIDGKNANLYNFECKINSFQCFNKSIMNFLIFVSSQIYIFEEY